MTSNALGLLGGAETEEHVFVYHPRDEFCHFLQQSLESHI